jgi:hypothetical protein
MTDLEKQAEELGIKVDGRWSEERLQQEIDKALAGPEAKNEADDTKAELAALRAEKAERDRLDAERAAAEKLKADQEKAEEIAAAAKAEKEAKKLFPVTLTKNYRPAGKFKVKADADAEEPFRDPTAEEELKVLAGTIIALPVAEAQTVVSKKIADRNDPIA